MLKNGAERERLMQCIELASACPVKGGTDLLSKQQAEKWLAEVAENVTQPVPIKALEEVGPMLVPVVSDSPLAHLFFQEWSATCGVWLESDAEETVVLDHLRSLIQVRVEGDLTVLFRYFELQAEHCPPLDNASKVMAELLPKTFARSMKVDQIRSVEDTDALGATLMKDPTPANIKAYTDAMHRAREREKVLAQHPEASDQAPGEWSAEAWDGQSSPIRYGFCHAICWGSADGAD
ncbi:DUF4123 domain-containing protein [Pseudomonas sp. 10S4]|uniref:DUF4123 domain-containing protein n=1 Tax=Pseudomonas sp. 10S4 TaxID=3048583 RepID=UPI002B22EB58|nr:MULTISPECIES: DUF4123 domain-containing protein [unclassified Pseudomonas]MEB0224874.1 DUF4123 domain-containing protein [Pseudomonas sp. 5S1]MEB0294784.1 DUF4123 domain-containing protein [Pseudomonas sp. 10S4]